jgi:tape measure domain-containing protein
LATIDPVVGAAGARAGQTFGARMQAALSGFVSRIGVMLKTGLVLGTAAAVLGLGALTSFGLKAAASLEQTTIGIEALLGSTKEAAKFIGELQEFSAKTPFEFKGVADASRRILAFGTSVGIAREQVIPTLTVIGDLISVLGGTQDNIDSVIRAFGQMASKGKVSQEEILQLAEALPGFNVNAAIAAKLGLSVADTLKLITAGGVDARTGINSILEGMAKFPGAAGAMAKQSQTLTGVFSTFKDTISIALTSAFQPVIPAIKDALVGLTPVLGDVIGQLAPKLGLLLQALLPLIGVFSQITTPILVPILAELAKIIPILQPALKALGEAFASIVAALAPLIEPLAVFIAELAKSLAPVIVALAPDIAELAKPLGDFLLALVPLLPPLSELLVLGIQMQQPMVKLLALFLDLLAIKGLVPLVELLAGALDKLAKAIGPNVALVSDLSNWPKIFGGIRDTVVSALTEIGDFFAALPGRIGSFLVNLPSMLGDLARTALERMAFAVGFGIGKIIRFFLDLPGKVIGAILTLGPMLADFLTSTGENAKNDLIAKFLALVDFVKTLPGKVVEALRELPGKLVNFATELVPKAIQLGKDIVSGVVRGIKDTIGGVGSALKDGFDNALAGIKKGLGIGSPAKVYVPVGEEIVAGSVVGVQNMADKAQAAIMGALAPAASARGAAPAAAPRQAVDVHTDDPFLSLVLDWLREQIRRQHGGDVDLALSTTS